MVEAAVKAYKVAGPAACRAVAAQDEVLDAACDRASRTVIGGWNPSES